MGNPLTDIPLSKMVAAVSLPVFVINALRCIVVVLAGYCNWYSCENKMALNNNSNRGFTTVVEPVLI